MQSSYFFLRTSAGFLSLELVLGALLVHEEIGLNTRTFPSGHFCLAVCHRFSAHRLQIRRAARASHGLELSSWERFLAPLEFFVDLPGVTGGPHLQLAAQVVCDDDLAGARPHIVRVMISLELTLHMFPCVLLCALGNVTRTAEL